MIKPDLNNMKDMQYYQKFLSLNNELENLETNIKNLKMKLINQIFNYKIFNVLKD